MKIKKTEPRVMTWQIIVSIICLSYTLGIAFGFLFADKFNLYPIIELGEVSSNNLFNNMFFYMKFSFPIWISGFFSIGIFFAIPWCVICGCFYGVSAITLVSFGDSLGFFINVLCFILFTGTVFLFSISSMILSLNQYKNYRNPKARLPREKTRKFKEHVIVFIIGIALSLIASLIKSYVS